MKRLSFLFRIDRKIDGASLLTLNNETIRQLLNVSDKNEQLIEQFKQKLCEWKKQYNVDNNNRRTE